MQISLKQEELELALKDYVLKMGLTAPIEHIVFTAARSQGGRIITEINLGGIDASIPNTHQSVNVPASGAVSDSQSPTILKEATPVAKEEVSIGDLISKVVEKEEAKTPVGKPLFGS